MACRIAYLHAYNFRVYSAKQLAYTEAALCDKLRPSALSNLTHAYKKHSGRAAVWKRIPPGRLPVFPNTPSENAHIIHGANQAKWTMSGSKPQTWLTGQFLWRGVAFQSQTGLYYGGTFLIRSTAGKAPALKVQFPLWYNTAIEGGCDRIMDPAELEIEMLKSKQSGNRNDWRVFTGAKSKLENHQRSWTPASYQPRLPRKELSVCLPEKHGKRFMCKMSFSNVREM